MDNEQQDCGTKDLSKSSNDAELLKLRFEYAWRWFDFHGKQRMQLFNFFLIIAGVLATALVSGFKEREFEIAIGVCILGVIQTIGFYIFDVRSRDLTRFSEDVLEKLEIEHLLPKDFSNAIVAEGNHLGILAGDREAKMREGSDVNRGRLKKLKKMKVWIRIIEISVGIAFVLGLIFAISKLHQENKLLEHAPMPMIYSPLQ
jgi:hypothetical protein